MSAPRTDGRRSPTVVLALLLLVYSFNWIDRQILGILVPSIKIDLDLTDRQLGLLGGLAFALLYSTMAVPLGWIADRTSRSGVIAVSLAVWSLFTAACGFATSFATLFVARIGVGVGEAGGVAPSYALIADRFPPERRTRALGIYALGVPIGTAAGVLLGGRIATMVDWRAAFIVVGLAGIILAPIFALLVREPRRAPVGAAAAPAAVGHDTIGVFAIIARKPSFWLLSLAAAIASMVGYGFVFWTPSLMERSFGLGLLDVSYFMAGLALIGGGGGILAGGLLGDRLGTRDRGAYARVPAICLAAAVPLFAAGMSTRSVPLAFALLLVPQGLALLWLAPVVTAVQHLVPASMRATASACYLLILNLIGLGAGSWILGDISDFLRPRFGAESLRYSMLAVLPFYLVAALLLAIASRRLARDWQD